MDAITNTTYSQWGSALTIDDIRRAAALIKPPPIKRGDIVVISLDDWALNTERCEQILEMCAEYEAHAEWSSNFKEGDVSVMRQPALKLEIPTEYRLPCNESRHWATFGASAIGYPIDITVSTV